MEIMKYYKEENGKKVWLGNILIVDNKQIINPTEEQILKAGYIKYEIPEQILSEEQLLTLAINDLVQKIQEYDNSNKINICTINYEGNNFEYWADKNERNNLKTALRDCINLGITTYRLDLRDLGITISLSCEQLLGMLSALEIYAIECYNKTTDHIYAAKSLTSIEEINQYDYTTGYPQILNFEV